MAIRLSSKESACQCRRRKRHGIHPWVGKILWHRKWHPRPLQYSCLENPMDRGTWWATVQSGAKSPKSCPTLCDPMDCSPPGSSLPGVFQARILEWVTTSFSRGSSQPRYQTHISYISCIGRQILYY